MNAFKSILAGCKYSIAITRVYLMRNIKGLDEDHPEANTSLFVDDTAMHAKGISWQEIKSILIPALLSFKKRVSNLKLRLSPKAVIVTNNYKIIKLLAAELKKHKLFFVSVRSARDLGVDNTAGKRRPSKLVNTRLTQSKHKIKKISK